MLSINEKEIEHDGSLSELLTDTSMILDFIYDQLVAEVGHRQAERLLRKLPKIVIKRKREERK